MNVVDEGANAGANANAGERRPASKPSKRSRRSAPTSVAAAEEEDLDDGASSRLRRKSAAVNFAENKRRDCIKNGLEELQRNLPHIGTPEEEKVSIFYLKKCR